MKVYVVTQNEGGGCKRIRGVFSTEAKAKRHIAPLDNRETIICNCCKQQIPNPEYGKPYGKLEDWRNGLSVKEWEVK